METTESKAISSLSGYMYFADISIVNSGVREVYARVYHLVTRIYAQTILSMYMETLSCPDSVSTHFQKLFHTLYAYT